MGNRGKSNDMVEHALWGKKRKRDETYTRDQASDMRGSGAFYGPSVAGEKGKDAKEAAK